jgi:hypothetical protein
MKPKPLMLVLGLLGLIAFIGVGRGLFQEQASSGAEFPDWISRMDEWVPKQVVKIEDISSSGSPAACLNRRESLLVIPSGGLCRYALSDGTWPRRLVLEMQAGGLAKVEIHQPLKENGATGKIADELVQSGGEAELNIPGKRVKKGRTLLVVGCLDPTAACALRIAER